MNRKEGFFKRIAQQIEDILPMKIGTFFLFLFILYLIFIVCRVVIINYKSNKNIETEEAKVIELQEEIRFLRYEINYYQTYSFKEKEAREKLGYKAPGETAVSLPADMVEDKIADSGNVEAEIRQPNYRLWWQYFFEK